MNAGFVRRHGKFGKSKLRPNRRYLQAVWFGVPGSAKFVRGYPKPQIGGFRLEQQLNRDFLDRHGIKTPEDFARLPEILIRQIGFFRVNWTELSRYMRRHLRHPQALLSMARRRSGILIELLTFLRSISIANPDRFLLPMAINGRISEALKQWAEQWNRDGEKNGD
jgi:hypothetical protein